MWFRNLRSQHDPALRVGVSIAPRRSQKFGPRVVEALEDRALMSQMGQHPILPQPLPFTRNFTETNLVTNSADNANHGLTGNPVIDSNLVNPWGIAFGPTSPFWVADNGMRVSTLYDGAGNPQPPPQPPPSKGGPLVVTIPTPGDPLGASGTPTGTVFNIDGGARGDSRSVGLTRTENR